MKHVKGEIYSEEFEIQHGKSGYYYIPYHVNHSGKTNHKVNISSVIKNDEPEYDIMFYVLNEDQFSQSIPAILQDAEGNQKADFEIELTTERRKKPKMTLDVEESETLFILFDNSYSRFSDKIIRVKIQEEWDEVQNKDFKVKNSVFVIMPIGNSEMDDVYKTIKSECRKLDLKAKRVDEMAGSNPISDDIIAQIKKSEFCIVDLTFERPNVYYELGYTHGIGNKGNQILLIAKKGTKLHFDISGLRVRYYDSVVDLHEIIYDDLEQMIVDRQ